MHDAAKTELAIQGCLAKCIQSDFPLTCLSDYARGLREHGWNEESVEFLERRVIKALHVISTERKRKAR